MNIIFLGNKHLKRFFCSSFAVFSLSTLFITHIQTMDRRWWRKLHFNLTPDIVPCSCSLIFHLKMKSLFNSRLKNGQHIPNRWRCNEWRRARQKVEKHNKLFVGNRNKFSSEQLNPWCYFFIVFPFSVIWTMFFFLFRLFVVWFICFSWWSRLWLHSVFLNFKSFRFNEMKLDEWQSHWVSLLAAVIKELPFCSNTN